MSQNSCRDALDLAERATLAINGLTGPTDPQADYEIYWWVNFLHHPPVMVGPGKMEIRAFPFPELADGAVLLKEIRKVSDYNENCVYSLW